VIGLTLHLLQPAPAASTTGRIHILIDKPGQNKLALALPTPIGTTLKAELDRSFHATLKRDLELSGWFDVIDPAAYLEKEGTGVRPGEFSWTDWEAPGAAVLGKTGLRPTGTDYANIRAEVWVYDVAGRRKLGAKAFTATGESIRSLAHKVANEIIFQVTGRQGPFNTRFAFAGRFSGNKEIYLVDWDGQGLAQITRNGSINIQPTWNKLGNRLAFTSYVSGNPDLYVADLVRGRITRLSSRSGINSGASWSPDGKTIALTLAPKGDPDIYAIDAANGRHVARLTRDEGIDVSPVYSPDGAKIAFVSERGGGVQVYVMNVDGTGVRRVTFQGNHNTDPAWSPDGTKLAFVSRDRHFDVFTVRADGTGMRRITQSAGDNEDPSWSPDGNYIAFSSTRAGGNHIWMSTADGTHQVQLTRGKGGYSNPVWSPILTW
jgi:TolB protein